MFVKEGCVCMSVSFFGSSCKKSCYAFLSQTPNHSGTLIIYFLEVCVHSCFSFVFIFGFLFGGVGGEVY